MDDNKVSFYMEKKWGSGGGFFESYCDKDIFGANFELDDYSLNNLGYKKSIHAIKKYPAQFFTGN
jgi:hypothetical protein